MNDRDDAKSADGSAADLERIELLLHDASQFVPADVIPDDLVALALSRNNGRAVARQRYGLVGVSGATALAAFSLIWAMTASVRPNALTITASAMGQATLAPFVRKITHPGTRERRVMGATSAGKIRNLPRLAQHRSGHRRRRYHTPSVDRLALAVIPRTVRSDPAPRIAFATPVYQAPVQSCWTTEVVRQTNYVLVSPGIVTEGTGESERVTPVLVPLQIDPVRTATDTVVDSSDRTPDTH